MVDNLTSTQEQHWNGLGRTPFPKSVLFMSAQPASLSQPAIRMMKSKPAHCCPPGFVACHRSSLTSFPTSVLLWMKTVFDPRSPFSLDLHSRFPASPRLSHQKGIRPLFGLRFNSDDYTLAPCIASAPCFQSSIHWPPVEVTVRNAHKGHEQMGPYNLHDYTITPADDAAEWTRRLLHANLWGVHQKENPTRLFLKGLIGPSILWSVHCPV